MGQSEQSPEIIGKADRWFRRGMLLLCLSIGCAFLHANLLPTYGHDIPPPGDEDFLPGYSVGWPILYGNVTSPRLVPWFWSYSRSPKTSPLFLLADIFVGVVLVAAPLAVIRLRRSAGVAKGQITLSGLFSLTTVVAMVFALLALERQYGWATLNDCIGRWPGVYSALSMYPWIDRVLIAIGVSCALYVAIKAVLQIMTRIATKTRC
jgi:hypothetical protein